MERFYVDAMRAFEMLRELSQTSNTRLVDIANRVIETRGTCRHERRKTTGIVGSKFLVLVGVARW